MHIPVLGKSAEGKRLGTPHQTHCNILWAKNNKWGSKEEDHILKTEDFFPLNSCKPPIVVNSGPPECCNLVNVAKYQIELEIVDQ